MKNTEKERYRIAGKFGEFGELFKVCQTLTSQNLAYKWHPYGQNLSIRQTLFHQFLLLRQLAKH